VLYENDALVLENSCGMSAEFITDYSESMTVAANRHFNFNLWALWAVTDICIRVTVTLIPLYPWLASWFLWMHF